MLKRSIIVLINGPPQCGKDTIANELLMLNMDSARKVIKFADPIREAMQVMFPVEAQDIEKFKEIPFSPYTELPNDEPYPIFTGRDLMIDFSEDYVKPHLGKDWFGIHAAKRAIAWLNGTSTGTGLVVVSDCGFVEEAKAFVHEIRKADREDRPPAYVALWRVHRPGYSFMSDSRNWVADVGENSHSMIANSGDLAQLRELVAAEFEGILSQASVHGRR